MYQRPRFQFIVREIIQFIDTDDLLSPRKIELQMARLIINSDCISICEWARFNQNPAEAVVIDLCQECLLAGEDSDRSRRACATLWQCLAHASYPYSREIANKAISNAHEMHSVTIKPEGGVIFRVLSAIFFWKAARVLQVWIGRK